MCICIYVLSVSLISMPTLSPNSNEEVRSMRAVLAGKGPLFLCPLYHIWHLWCVRSEDNMSNSLLSPPFYPFSLSAFSWSSYISHFLSLSWVFQIILLCLFPVSLPSRLSFYLQKRSFVFMTFYIAHSLFIAHPQTKCHTALGCPSRDSSKTDRVHM